MEYFKHFPKVEYGQFKAVDILARAKVREAIRDHLVVYYPYIVRDGDRPDILAHKYYGNPKYTWIIFYANNIIDPLEEWPKTTVEFEAYLTKKYGSVSASKLATRHFENLEGFVIDQETFNSLPTNQRVRMTYFDYENRLNESRREILLIEPSYISQIMREFRSIFK